MTNPTDDIDRPRPVASTTTVHLDAHHVSATDLTSYTEAPADLASLTFGDETVRIVFLGQLDKLQEVVMAAWRHLSQLEARRAAGMG